MMSRELVANLSAYPGQIYTESFPLPKNNMARVEFRSSYFLHEQPTNFNITTIAFNKNTR